jgi:hypothetical protein
LAVKGRRGPLVLIVNFTTITIVISKIIARRISVGVFSFK